MPVIYIAHVLRGNPAQYEGQFCFSMCVNEFMQLYNGHYEGGKWVESPFSGEEIPEDVTYTRDEYEEGIVPPTVIIELMKWMDSKGYWAPWMQDLSNIALLKRHTGSASM